MDRRRFILAAAALAAGCSREETASGAWVPEPEAPAGEEPEAGALPAGEDRGRPLGVQLYTVRELMAEDVAATLALVAGIGYREVEVAG